MDKDVLQAVIDILKYIQKYPYAKHTRNGIVKNWIFQQRLEEKLNIAETAIDYLVKDGILDKIEKEDKDFYIRINNKKIKDISSKIIEYELRRDNINQT